MAYLVFIASVDDKEYQDFLLNLKNISLIKKFFNKTPSLKTYNSFRTTCFLMEAKHYNKNFNDGLNELLMGGTMVDDYFWHPLAPAQYHSSSETKKLYTDIKENYDILLKFPDNKDYDEYFESEIKKVITGLQYSVDNNLGLIVMYEKPHDRARATRTKYVKFLKADK